ncbi:MAG TPA: GtrA family protein [Mycobacteriales bacterium]|nr:GtrA family protein [Mycobacteriales bacterium]
MRAVYRRFEVVIHEIAKFGLVGAFNAILDIGLANVLHFRVGLGPLTSKTLATAVAATSSYFMNRHWSFAHRARTTFRREYTLFFFLNAVGLGIALLVVGFVRYALGFSSVLAFNVANVLGIGLGTLWRFYAYKRWVFVAPPAPTDEEITPAEAAISTIV